MTERVAPRNPDKKVSVVVLAGGQGERLGGDKATVMLAGQRLLDRAIDRMACLSDDLIVVVRAGQDLEHSAARVVTDVLPDAGVLAGLAAGLQAARCPWAAVVACDMPFLDVRVFDLLIARTKECDAVVPRLDVGLEPLHALYSRRCLPAILACLKAGRRRVISFYTGLRVCYFPERELLRVDPDKRSFFNINTPEDLQWARGQLENASGWHHS